VRRDRLHLILDLNLVTGSSPQAARWARAARHDLPGRSIVGFEIGNEPDIYDRWSWVQQLGRPRTATPFLPRRLSAATYLADFRAYAHALVRVAPRIPLVGPALANPQTNLNWLAGLITGAHPGLGLISAHRYPYSACVRHTAPAYPSIAKVLSENATAGLARTVIPSVRLAERSGLPFRLTELNSVTCGGVPGISDTFATALWAPDALFELMRAGVDGANVHVRAYAVNAAFALKRSGFHARPLMYGLILFTRTVAPGARLAALRLGAAPDLHLKAWGVRLPGGRLHVLLIDKGPRAVRVALALPAAAPADVQRLTAPSVRARFGVTLAGQQLDAAGHWVGRRVSDHVGRVRGTYTVTLPAMSAALVSVPGRPYRQL
jgi:Glycosyl hydrolase family 79 C-terminal beta domain